jgi:hypothetical protein
MAIESITPQSKMAKPSTWPVNAGLFRFGIQAIDNLRLAARRDQAVVHERGHDIIVADILGPGFSVLGRLAARNQFAILFEERFNA